MSVRICIFLGLWCLLMGSSLMTGSGFLAGMACGWGLGWALHGLITDTWPEDVPRA